MPEESISTQVEQQARRAIIEHAVVRWENALIIAGTLLLTFFVPVPFPGWPVWGWLALGALGVGGMVYSSLNDKAANRKVVSDLFLQKFDTREINDRNLRQKLDQAVDYYSRIQQAIESQDAGIVRDRLGSTISQINDWLANMFRIARRLDIYRQDKVIQRDRQAVPRDVANYRERLRREDDSSVAEQLRAALTARETQQAALERLDNVMERAELQMEQSLAALGTIYPQIQLIGARDVDSSRTQRLQADIADQVHTLDDLISSINEVYNVDLASLEPAATAVANARKSQQAGQ
jgi:molybdopterin converting factor small subunit